MRRVLIFASATVVATLIALPTAYAVVVPLDPTFSSDGKVRLPSSVMSNVAGVDVVDGYVFAAGVDTSTDPSAAVVLKLNDDGTSANGFGVAGTARFELAGMADVRLGMTVAGDGSVALVAQSKHVVAVLRLTSGGELDTTFSGDGMRRWSVTGSRLGQPGVTIDSTGRMVVAFMGIARKGLKHGVDVLVYRLTPAGSFDATFSGNSVQRLNYAPIDWMDTLALDQQDRVLIGSDNAFSEGVTSATGSIIRLGGNGRLDTNFSGNGVARFKFAPDLETWPLAIGVDGSGSITAGLTGAAYGAVRLSASGERDPTYGDNGILGVTCRCYVYAADVENGRVALTGPHSGKSLAKGNVIVRISQDGTSLSQGWNDLFPATPSETAYEVAIDGTRTVLGGEVGQGVWLARVG